MIEQKRQEAIESQETLQPFMILLGPLKNISAIYVIVDLIKYQVDSVLEALDLTFKIFFVSHCEFPSASCHIWLFLQKTCYDINVPGIKYGIQLHRMFNELAKMQNSSITS